MLLGRSNPPLKQLDTNLPLIHSNLALTYHNPNEAMRLTEIFPKKVYDNNLTQEGYGRLNVAGIFDALIGV